MTVAARSPQYAGFCVSASWSKQLYLMPFKPFVSVQRASINFPASRNAFKRLVVGVVTTLANGPKGQVGDLHQP